VLINEIAWSGSIASASDEWIELHNPGPSTIDLAGWRLTDGGDLNVALAGSIPAYSFFLLERTDDSSVAGLAADQIYTGALRNGGEALELLDPSGTLIDSANSTAGSWPAGDSSTKATMERLGGADIPGNWVTSSAFGPARDAEGNLIRGTPRGTNSAFLPTPTASPIATPVPSPTAFPGQMVLINEIAWSGTQASSSDEWIELLSTTSLDLSLAGWRLSDGGDVAIALNGTLPAYGYFLLERTDDSTVSDIAANQIYVGSLRDSGEILELVGPSGELIDTANRDGGGWPAGESGSRSSMERRGDTDGPGNWGTYTGFYGNGTDAAGNPIHGTPGRVNSLFFPTPTPTGVPSRLVINEVLIRPHYDWEGSGGVTTGDEFIELYNTGRLPVYLKGWFLDDASDTGSRPFELPGVTISGKGYAVFFRTLTKIALNDSGDTVRLLRPDGRLVDEVSYLPVRAYNLSFGRLPDGSDNLHYGLWPTPRQANLTFVESPAEPVAGPFYPWICPGQGWPAGGKIVRASMQRRGPVDNPASWMAFVGPWSGGRDAEGGRISGSPGEPNATAPDPIPGGDTNWPSMVINEIAWDGTKASRADEWIELHNTTSRPIELSGWFLTDGNDLRVALSGTVPPGGYLLMERDDDEVVSDHLADMIYSGSLRDDGEVLWLFDAEGTLVDSANTVRDGAPTPVPGRVARSPSSFAWLNELELLRCGP
jgi:hypothetical protein